MTFLILKSAIDVMTVDFQSYYLLATDIDDDDDDDKCVLKTLELKMKTRFFGW